jgi:hypothetical protein
MNLFDPAVLEDPYPTYAYLRAHSPVLHADIFGGAWLVFGYDDVVAALRDAKRLSSGREVAPIVAFPPELKKEYEAFSRFYSNIMLVFDGDKHRRVRGLVSKVFTPTALKSLTSIVEQMVAELLDPLESDGGMELVQDFAYPLPAIVIAELMGLPWEDRDRLKVWADDLALFIGGGTNPEEMAAAAQRSMVDMATYFEGWIEHRRREPSDDLISRLITVDEGGETLTDEEIWAQCLLLLTAGHQTTRDLISGGLWALFNHPEQLALLREDLSKVPSATEECLRYDSSVQMAGRMTVEPVEIGGQAIDAGQRVIMILGSANRDGNQFPDPDSFLIDRQSNRHLAFGAGPHHCLGGSLARLEGQVALRMMLERFPNLRAATDRPERKLNATFRRINHLPVAWN